MNKSIVLIGVLALVAIGGFSLYFVNQSRLSEQEAAMQKQQAQFEQEQERLEARNAQIMEEQRASAALARQAEEARRMAERQAEQERQQREQLVASLNEKLNQEVEERQQAEAAQKELAMKTAALEEAQKESREALLALEAERTAMAGPESTTGPGEAEDVATLRKMVETQEQQLVALTVENESLKEKQEQLEQRQIDTEEAILSAGGRVSIPYPEIRSPNVRRREAIYFKERVAGHPSP